MESNPEVTGETPEIVTPVSEKKRRWKLVTHEYPDTDALVCLWAAIRFVVRGDDFKVVCVRSGEHLSAEDTEGFEVLHMDTGLGELDQHGRQLERSSSFELFCKKYRLINDEALWPILELTKAADNIEEIPWTSVHYVFKGLPRHFKDPETKQTNWTEVMNSACAMLDIIYDQMRHRLASKRDFERLGRCYTLPGGVKLACVWHHPRLREAAFETGANVVVWTQDIKDTGGKYYVGIQVHRAIDLKLSSTMAAIRQAEGRQRKIDVRGINLSAIGSDSKFGAWFLHDSEKLIVCGSRTHPLEEDGEFTKLTQQDIFETVRGVLKNLKPAKKKT